MSAIRIPVYFNSVKEGLASELQIVMEIPITSAMKLKKCFGFIIFLREMIGENI